ncbi:cuticlin-1 isoform X2 [Periplaneta americana]|uniref:cuticlin-1 isoform X2 n=1 Tax=Periplaneta americana TaxID=6978 RepID=UPI0037E8128B
MSRGVRIPIVSCCVLFVLLTISSAGGGEVWRQEVGSQMEIGVSQAGYRRVQLRCGADYMQVDVETDDDFDGVIYTRGSYHNREAPCFLDPRGGRSFSLKFPLSQCHTKLDSEIYSNVVVVQHDDELIMPGDAAFTVECDFSRPRDITVSADLEAGRPAVSSRISIADADPAGKELPRHRRSTVSSESGSVSFTPEDVRPRRKRADSNRAKR